jgi:hypothetical protein
MKPITPVKCVWHTLWKLFSALWHFICAQLRFISALWHFIFVRNYVSSQPCGTSFLCTTTFHLSLVALHFVHNYVSSQPCGTSFVHNYVSSQPCGTSFLCATTFHLSLVALHFCAQLRFIFGHTAGLACQAHQQELAFKPHQVEATRAPLLLPHSGSCQRPPLCLRLLPLTAAGTDPCHCCKAPLVQLHNSHLSFGA